MTKKNLKANTEVQKKDEKYAVTFTPGSRVESRKSSRKVTIIDIKYIVPSNLIITHTIGYDVKFVI